MLENKNQMPGGFYDVFKDVGIANAMFGVIMIWYANPLRILW